MLIQVKSFQPTQKFKTQILNDGLREHRDELQHRKKIPKAIYVIFPLNYLKEGIRKHFRSEKKRVQRVFNNL